VFVPGNVRLSLSARSLLQQGRPVDDHCQRLGALLRGGAHQASLSIRRRFIRRPADIIRRQSEQLAGVASKGVRCGNWLSLKQAQAPLNAPDITTTKGLRDRANIAVLLGCGLRRSEMSALTLKHIQQRDGRRCIVDLVGKHGGVRI
jgi:site-specific recombinase XerD